LIPLSQIDLEDMILAPLPEGYHSGGTSDNLSILDVPEPLEFVYQEFVRKDGKSAGGMRIYLYESKNDVKEAYEIEAETLTSISTSHEEIYPFGNNVIISSYTLGDVVVTDLVFSRCYAVVVIRMLDIPDEATIIDFGQQLDENISEYICRPD